MKFLIENEVDFESCTNDDEYRTTVKITDI